MSVIQEVQHMRQQVWQEYITAMNEDTARKREWKKKELVYNDVVMRFRMTVKGFPGPDGYPVYIALHGGGFGITPDVNNQQWNHMGVYYLDGIKNGIYISPRGIRDTWNTHFNEESYPLYDRMIADVIAYENADPNRIYILGFSAGGDGVYGIAPRMADRFAAANMSAGHPNDICMENMYRLPIQLQVGALDHFYGRNKMTPTYGKYLDELQKQYGGFEHNVFVHWQKPHNFRDNHPEFEEQTVYADPVAWLEKGDETTTSADTNAISFLNRYTRNPVPERVIWNLSVRAGLREIQSFYWLSMAGEVQEGRIIASYDRKTNLITLEEVFASGLLTIYVNEDMVDFDRPVAVKYGKETACYSLAPERSVLEATTWERGDASFQFSSKIEIEL